MELSSQTIPIISIQTFNMAVSTPLIEQAIYFVFLHHTSQPCTIGECDTHNLSLLLLQGYHH